MNLSELVPTDTPQTTAIAAKLKELGGTPLRARMIEGRMQYWTSLPGGRVMAWANLWNCQRGLGINVSRKERQVEAKNITDPVSIIQAAKISGYSSGAIIPALRAGEIECDRSKKPFILSKASVIAWAESHRKRGGVHLPRGKRKKDAAVPKTISDRKGWHSKQIAPGVYTLTNGSPTPKATIMCEDDDLPKRIARLLALAADLGGAS